MYNSKYNYTEIERIKADRSEEHQIDPTRNKDPNEMQVVYTESLSR